MPSSCTCSSIPPPHTPSSFLTLPLNGSVSQRMAARKCLAREHFQEDSRQTMKTQCLKGGGTICTLNHFLRILLPSMSDAASRANTSAHAMCAWNCEPMSGWVRTPRRTQVQTEKTSPAPTLGVKDAMLLCATIKTAGASSTPSFRGHHNRTAWSTGSLVRRCLTKHALSKIINNYM